MIFNRKWLYCFKNNNLIKKQSEAKFQLSQKKKICFLRVIDEEWVMTQALFSFLLCFCSPYSDCLFQRGYSMKVLHWTYIQIGPRLVALIVTLCNDLWLQRLCESDMWLYDEVVNFGATDVSGVRTHGVHQPALTYHNANIENTSIKDVTKSISDSEFYILRIYFSIHQLPPKTTTMKFSPQSAVNL